MQRFYFSSCPKNLEIKDTGMIHQFTKVLRLNTWEKIIGFMEDGYDYVYEIQNIEKKTITLIQKEKKKNICEPEKYIRLFQALPNKLEKIEYILQKGVEIGIGEFIFFRADRSQKLHISENKHQRLEKIITEATEQCGGNKRASLQILEKNTTELPLGKESIIADFQGGKIREIPKEKKYDIYIGPEGGWSEDERKFFQEKKSYSLTLGNRILRTETAGIIISSGILFL